MSNERQRRKNVIIDLSDIHELPVVQGKSRDDENERVYRAQVRKHNERRVPRAPASEVEDKAARKRRLAILASSSTLGRT